MRKSRIILLGAVVLGSICAICRVDQDIAVAWIQFQSPPLVETGARVAYITSLLERGEVGKRATRKYVTLRWRRGPPQSYDISMLYRAKAAFVGLSEKELTKLVGTATRVDQHGGSLDLVYDGQQDQTHVADQRPRVIFHLDAGRVADVSRWVEFIPKGELTNEFASGWMEWLPDGHLRKQGSPYQTMEDKK